MQTDSLHDQELVKQLPGFTSNYINVNGIQLHYVTGGQGKPLVLLPGWPQTWWSYHKIMPLLSRQYQLFVVDLRGMGGSDKPQTGYNKKTMASDIVALLDEMGIEKASVAGHDIGAAVAFSFAAHFPDRTGKLILLDTPHPDENMYRLPMLPVGTGVHPWWVAFNQIRDLPEQVLEGRFHLVQDWLFDQLLEDKTAINAFDRQVYARAYSSKEAIRASNAWYQAFTEDIQEIKGQKIGVPTLGIGSPAGYEMFSYVLPSCVDHFELKKVEGSGHFIQEEKPAETAQFMMEFLG